MFFYSSFSIIINQILKKYYLEYLHLVNLHFSFKVNLIVKSFFQDMCHSEL